MVVHKESHYKVYIKTFFSVLLIFLFYMLICMGIVQLCKVSYDFCYEVFGNVVMEHSPGTEKEFEVKKQDTIYSVSKKLEKDRIISNKYSFYIRVKLTLSKKEKFSSGMYRLNTSMTYEEIINTLTSNEFMGG